jgi:hypothetical protein
MLFENQEPNENQAKILAAFHNPKYPQGIRSLAGLAKETGLSAEEVIETIISLMPFVMPLPDDRFILAHGIVIIGVEREDDDMRRNFQNN